MNGRSKEEAATAYDTALRLLSRREHSRRELRLKLQLREHADECIEPALDRLSAEGYLSDRRFAEAYAAERVGKGFGPRRIEAELGERGIDTAGIAAALAPFADCWSGLLTDLATRRFGELPPASRREWQKRARFLEARGFRADSIRRVLGDYA